MIISLLPTTALAAEKNNVWSKEYGTIRVYLDKETKKDLNNLEGYAREVRIISPKGTVKDGDGNRMQFCAPLGDYWWTENTAKVTANDITRIDLARDKLFSHSSTIQIPIGGNETYKVTVSEGKDILIKYLCIEITKREHHTVTYKFSDPAPENVSVPEDTATYTETSPVTLLDPDKTSVTGTLNGKDGIWTFNGWTVTGDQTDKQIPQEDKKFIMPDEDVTVTGKWTFEATPPTGTPVYVYFKTVNTKNELVQIENNVVKYNKNGNSWATLGKLETTTNVATASAEELGNEVIAGTGFTRHDSNSGLDLGLIKSWDAPHQESGAVDYVDAGYVWHLDGTVYGYRAIYYNSDGTELAGFTPKYYLEGTTDIKVTDKTPTAPAGKTFDCWVTDDVTVKGNTFKMPDHDVTFTPKWKPGTLKIEKILDDNSPAAEKTFSFTVTPGNKTVEITGKGSETISDLPVGDYTVAEDSNTAAVRGYRCTTQYSKDCKTWQEAPITVSVASNSTVTVYVKNSYTPITADLIDDDITITHGVDATPADGDDTAAHIVNKDAKISYQATLDMQSLKFGDNPKNTDAVSFIKNQIGNDSPWEFMKGEDITKFAGSKVNLHVKFSDKLENPTELKGIALESGWFKLDPAKSPTYDGTTKYWTIPCVIKNADAEDAPDTSKSIITLSGVSLSLTEDAQNELRSDKDLDIISEGYIDGTIMISKQALKLESKTAKNTAKLKLAVPTYTVTYTDGANGSAFKDQVYSGLKSGVATPAFNGTPERDGYTFNSWEPAVDKTVTKDATYTATWTRNSSRDDDDDKYFFAIQKVDAQDGHALNGAKFELYQRDNWGNKLAAFRKTTSHWGTESGIALFSVSATKTSDGGSTWYYREITAPEGYVLDSTEHKIKATNFSDSRSTAVQNAVAVRNYRGTTPDLLNDSDHFAYVIGYMDGNVRPYGLISRAETTTIFFRLLKDSVRDGNLLTSNTYTDVADDYWANTAISTMTGLGIVQGRSTTTFDPKAPITRAQFAAICARFDTGKSSGEQTFSDIKGHWAEKYIQRAAELGWIKGFEDGTFRPDTYITRAQAMTMINRVLNRIPEDESDLLPGMNVWPDCNPGDWFYLAVQEATNSHDFEHKAGNYETWTKLMKNPDWTRYEN